MPYAWKKKRCFPFWKNEREFWTVCALSLIHILSMTPERSEQVDFAGPYFYASIVCLTKADSPYAQAKGLSDLAGATCTAQIATIWYDTCLPQIDGVEIKTAAESAPAMLMLSLIHICPPSVRPWTKLKLPWRMWPRSLSCGREFRPPR